VQRGCAVEQDGVLWCRHRARQSVRLNVAIIRRRSH
jgi:hypothetical protein